jgi:peptide/nickel transport system permease protein
MIPFIARRLMWIAVSMLVVSMLTFGLIFATGDPAVMLVPTRNNQPPDPALVERARRDRGLDQPLPIQYLTYVGRLVQGDMGYSFYLRRPVNQVLFEKLPNTALLAGLILLTSMAIGVPLGMLSALRRNTIIDRGILFFNTVMIAIPSFFLALMLIYFIAFELKLLPFSGSGSVRHFIMPVLSVAIPNAAAYAILLRTNLLNQVASDYARTAHAKGLHARVVAFRHLLPNALIPVVTLASLDLAYLLTGVVLVEQIFGFPGIGSQVLKALASKDIPVIMGSVFYGALLIGVGNLIADLLTARLDPRIVLD